MTIEPDHTSDGKSPWVGIAWMVLTGILFVCVTGIVRYLGSRIPAAESAFIRYCFGIVMMSPFLAAAFRSGLTRQKLTLYASRGFVHALGVILWFYAMANIPIAEVVAIGYTSPIYITLGAAIFFGEHLAMRRIVAVAVAFLGAMIIVRPGFHEVGMGQLAQLLSAPLFAVSYLIAKTLSGRENPTVVVGMLSIFVTLGLAPFALVQWQTPTLHELFWLAMVAGFATAGHFTMTKALQAAPLMVTQPVTFLQLVWATALGLFAFGEPVDIWVLLGGGIIIAAVSFISYREWVVSRRSRTPPTVAIK
jgi:drug/metabolite transporter (DMT)-like permease